MPHNDDTNKPPNSRKVLPISRFYCDLCWYDRGGCIVKSHLLRISYNQSRSQPPIHASQWKHTAGGITGGGSITLQIHGTGCGGITSLHLITLNWSPPPLKACFLSRWSAAKRRQTHWSNTVRTKNKTQTIKKWSIRSERWMASETQKHANRTDLSSETNK